MNRHNVFKSGHGLHKILNSFYKTWPDYKNVMTVNNNESSGNNESL